MPLRQISSHARRRRARQALAPVLVVGAGLWLAAAAPALPAEAVKTRAWDHDGFGRIVFDWGAPVGHRFRVGDGRLVLEFDRPMDATLDVVRERLSAYVSAARLEDDGRRAVFTLKGPLSARDASDGNLVVIDLVAAGQGDPAARAENTIGQRLAVRAGAHGDFTRLAFDWKEPVDYRATQSGDEIRIAFDHPASADLADIKADLPPFVTGIEQIPSPQGLLVILKVADGARLRHFRSETKVVADVLAPPGGEAQSAELTPADGPAVPAPAPAGTDPEQDGGAQSDKAPDKAPAAPEMPKQEPGAAPPQHMPAPGAPRRRTAIAAADAPVADTSAPTAAEVVAPPTRLYPPPARQAPAAPPQSALPQSALPEAAPPLSAAQPAAQSAAQPAAPPSLPAAERPATPPAGTAPPVQPTSAPAAQASQESMPLQPAAGPAVPPATPAATASVPVPPAAPVPPVTPERVSAPVSPVPPATPDRTSGPVPPAPAPMSAAPQPPAPAAAAAPLPAAPVSLLPRTAKAGAQAPATAADTAAADAAKAAATAAEAARPAAASNSPALQSAEAPALKVAATVNGDGLALRFPWSQPTAAAAYARAGSLWIVFDRRATLDLSALKTAGGPMIAAAEQVQADDATALRLKADAALNPELRLEGEAWVVDLKREELRPETPVALNAATPAGQASRFVVPLERAGHKVVLKDPEVGDTVVVVPVLAAGEGIETTRDYPLFRLLATAQGAAVESKADGLEIAATPEGLEITGPNGLFLSADARAPSSAGAQEQTDGAPATTSQPEPEPERAGTPSPVGAAAATGRLFDFAAWRHDDSPFEDVRQSLLQAAADAPEAARNEARMRLAEFYFARGFAAEALGVLRIVAESEPRYAGDPLFRAMRGVSRYLMGDYAGAAEDLSVPGLADSADAAVWRGAVAVAQGRWPDAAAAFATVGDRIPSYPPTMRTKLAEDAAETALNAGEFDAMKIYLDMAAKGAPDMAAQARAKFLLGRAAEKRGNRDEAAGLYDQAAAMGDTQVAVRATYAKVGMLLDAGKMTRPDAIKALEGLRYAWRGDAFEFDLLRRLGNLYLAESSYEQGLATLRRAVTLFPTIDGAEAVTQTMTEAFAKLYLEGAADSLPPLKALGLYQNFRELTPPGEKGDEMIRKLAERLVAVDLLDQAGELLQNQVDFRLQGETKARVGARLAAIRLLDKMPDRALSAIDSSAADNLPADLVAERRHLKARALAELGRSDDALAELKGDDGAEAETIRADILWDNRDWAGAAKVLARLASAIPPDGALGDDQSVTVLRLAVALWLANDRNDLEALRQRFTARMDNTPYHDDFRVIAAAPADDMESVQSIARRLAEVDQYEAFLAGLKQRAKDHQLANAAAN